MFEIKKKQQDVKVFSRKCSKCGEMYLTNSLDGNECPKCDKKAVHKVRYWMPKTKK